LAIVSVWSLLPDIDDTCSFKEEGTNYPEEFGAKAANTYFKAPLKNKEAFDHMNTEQGPITA
jgi:hypothetical protein